MIDSWKEHALVGAFSVCQYPAKDVCRTPGPPQHRRLQTVLRSNPTRNCFDLPLHFTIAGWCETDRRFAQNSTEPFLIGRLASNAFQISLCHRMHKQLDAEDEIAQRVQTFTAPISPTRINPYGLVFHMPRVSPAINQARLSSSWSDTASTASSSDDSAG
jgi:hypothetical protein